MLTDFYHGPLFFIMSDLIRSIEQLKKTNINGTIKERVRQFENKRTQSIEENFKDLCFCIMTANCSAEKCLEIYETIDDGFLYLSEEELSLKFRELGYRFPKKRAEYIIEARNSMDILETLLSSNLEAKLLREQLVRHFRGIGYKEGSHFLRNIGFKNLAIIDFHVIDLLVKYNLISRPNTLTRNRYMEIEEICEKIAAELNLTLAELDFYFLYLEIKKILR